jgi:hypothetical protein
VQAPQAIETPKTPGPTVGGFVYHHDREPLFVAIAYTAVDGFVFGQGRQAAQEEDFDLATAQKIADWLGVTPTSIIDAEGVGKDALAAQIAAVLQSVQKQKPMIRTYVRTSTALRRSMKSCRGPGRLARPGSSSCPSCLTSVLESVEKTVATTSLSKTHEETQTVGSLYRNQHKKDGLFGPSFFIGLYVI